MKSIIVFIVVCGLSFASCRTIKSDHNRTIVTVQTDTITERETIRLDTFRVPADSAKISVPISVFTDSGVSYLEKRNGRATVKIQRIKDVIYATAQCDSLEKIIAMRDHEIQRLRSKTTNETVIKRKTTIKNPFWLQLLLYACAALILIILSKKLITILKNKSWLRITKL